MKSSFLKKCSNQDGSLVGVMVVASLVGGVAYIAMNIQSYFIKSVKLSEESIEFQNEYYSAADTLYYAYKQEEQRYHKTLASCGKAKPFIEAIKKGSGCNSSVTVFKKGTGDGALYDFGNNGCLIRESSSSCEDGQSHVLSIKSNHAGSGSINPFSYYEYDFYIFGLIPEKNIIEFLAIISDRTSGKRILGGKRKRTFALVDSVRNIAHIEADGRVTEENPSPLSRCAGQPWQTLKSFNPTNLKCEEYTILGGAEGLAYYNGRYFGFRSFDGQIFDMMATITGGSILVNQNGTNNGQKIFPRYDKSYLFNTNDITLIDDTIYFVTGGGLDAYIGVLDMNQTPPVRKPVCKVGEMGWAQNYDGILATDRSQDLVDQTKIGNSATFYLKSSGGDLLTFFVLINNSGLYECYGLKDYNLQQIEYKRTYGFDRTEDSANLFHY